MNQWWDSISSKERWSLVDSGRFHRDGTKKLPRETCPFCGVEVEFPVHKDCSEHRSLSEER